MPNGNFVIQILRLTVAARRITVPYYFTAVILINPVFLLREIRAVGKMEFFAVFIAYIRAAASRRGRTYRLRGSRGRLTGHCGRLRGERQRRRIGTRELLPVAGAYKKSADDNCAVNNKLFHHTNTFFVNIIIDTLRYNNIIINYIYITVNDNINSLK